MSKAWDIAGYTYKAEYYTPADLVEVLIGEGSASPAGRDMSTEDLLDQIAGANGIDRMNESSFDSGDFPKVIFESQISDEDTWYHEA